MTALSTSEGSTVQRQRLLLVAVIIFYWFMATVYYITIVFNTRAFVKPDEPIWAAESYWRILMDYGLKLLLTIPIWLIIFKVLRKMALWQRLLVHVVTLPLFVFSWKALFYFFCDTFGYGHLRGDGQVWDIYIPFLFYLLQFAIFHVYDYYKALQTEQKLAARLKQLALHSEMATLKAQIQPHFLFNTLNSISASLPIEQEPTRKSIARLADTFRFAMNTAEKEQVPFREELAFIQNYLALEQERFTDRLRVVYAVDEAALHSCVPPFLLQPLIENALKHGIGKSIEGGTLELLVRVADQKTFFEIRDTGAGLNGYTKSDLLQKGIGLKNTRERLLKLFNEEIQISSLHPKGTNVQFSIPYIPCHA